MFCINKQKIKYLIYENSHYNLVPDHGSEGDAERVEDLVGSVQPDRRLQQHLQL